MIQAVFLDVDGTLIDDNHQIPQENIEVIEKVRKIHNTPVFLATGRAPQDLKIYYNQLGLDTPSICMNGAYVTNLKEGTLIKEDKIPLIWIEKIHHAIERLNKKFNLDKKKSLSLSYYQSERWLAHESSDAIENEVKNMGYAHIEILALKDMLALWEDEKSGPHKIGVVSNNEELLKQAYLILKEEFKNHLNILKSQRNFLEINTLNASKKNAIEFLLKHYYTNFKKENLIAIGDSDNDITMLEWVGISIAMGNASDHIKHIASDVTLVNNQAGVGKALRRYIIKDLP